MKLFVVLMFKRVRKEAGVVLKCKWVKNIALRGLKIESSQEWSCKGFWGSNDWRMRL